MPYANQQRGKLIFILLFCFLLCACSIENIDKKIGEELNKFEGEYKNDEASTTNQNLIAGSKEVVTNNLKQKIDKWIAENNLNRYGDNIGAAYAGGTPLFNESTGENIDRYEYILKNHPELLDILTSAQ
jgi:hypothetical protein